MNVAGMNVAGLICKLEDIPGDAVVYSEGCDCIEAAGDVKYDEVNNTLTVARKRGEFTKLPPRPTLEELERKAGIYGETETKF